MTLFDISGEFRRLDAILDECDGDLSKLGEQEAAVTELFIQIGQFQATKLDGYLNLMKLYAAKAELAKREKDEYAAKQKAFEAREAFLKARLLEFMLHTKQQRAETAAGRVVSVVKNGGTPAPIITATDPKALPPRFQKVTVEIDRAAVQAALKAGEELEFAELPPAGVHLRVK